MFALVQQQAVHGSIGSQGLLPLQLVFATTAGGGEVAAVFQQPHCLLQLHLAQMRLHQVLHPGLELAVETIHCSSLLALYLLLGGCAGVD